MKNYDERRKSVEQYMADIQRKRTKTLTAVIVGALAVAVLSLVLFIPYDTTPPDVSAYSDSPYYGVIAKLNLATFRKPKNKNRFESLLTEFYSLRDIATEKGELAGPEEMPQPADPYVEVTDNQVAGVIEADIFKRTRDTAFYLRGDQLTAYSIAGQDSQVLGIYTVSLYTAELGEDILGDFSYQHHKEMYLSQDGRTLTLLVDGYINKQGKSTVLISLDVTDPTNIIEKQRLYFSGSYISSRLVDGDILLIYNSSVQTDSIDYSDPSTFIPQYGIPGQMECIPAENIVCPENVNSIGYTVLCRLSEDLEMKGSTALLSYSSQLYVSEDTIYVTHNYSLDDRNVIKNSSRSQAMTEITGVRYGDGGLDVVGTVQLEGTVKDQYSMDQYEGILRVVTNTRASTVQLHGNGMISSALSDTDKNVNLYCIGLSDWKIVGSVIGFAPEGEEATSVRFDRTNAYVCTAEIIILSDPVFFFDLSDPENITWTDTGTINGYSTSLIQLGEGYLMGIGFGDNRDILKIEIYEQRDGKVVSVCCYEICAAFSWEYKSYYVDRDRNLIGLGIYPYDTNGRVYLLLHFDGTQLNQVLYQPTAGYPESMRAFMEDGWLYLFSNETFDVIKVG